MKHSHVRQYLAAFFCGLSAVAAGTAFVWITPLLPRLQEDDGEIKLTHEDVSWVVSLIEIGNLFSPLPAAYLADRIGRKPLILSVAPVFILTWLLVLFTREVLVLYAIRLIQGWCLGVLYTILPMYLGEIAEPALRGIVTVSFVAMEFLGILAVYCIGPFVSYQTLTWICIAPPIVFGTTFWYFPESPHFLLMRGKTIEANKCLKWLRAQDSLEGVNEELKIMTDTVTEQKMNHSSWSDIFYTRTGRKALFLVELVTITMMMTGFTAVLSYSTDTFNKIGATLIDPDITTIVIGFFTCSALLVSGGLVDKAGRRPILLISASGSTASLFLTALYLFYIEEIDVGSKEYQWVPYSTLIFFVTLANFGLIAIQPTLQAELFPNSTRSIASGITSLVICITSFIALKIYIPIQDAFGLYMVYTIYAGFTAVGTLLIYIFLPETKGKTFEEIQELL